MNPSPRIRQPDVTRQKLLDAAFDDIYLNGFQASSLNRIAEAAGVTKGALFHHFADKRALGHAVIDDVVVPLLMERWLAPLADADDPITAIQGAFRRLIREDTAEGAPAGGCPLNNLAQEMSPLDEGFRTRLDAAYRLWRTELAAALRAGIARGTVRGDVDPDAVAALVVSAQMGIWGTGKTSQDAGSMTRAGEGLCAVLDALRAPSAPAGSRSRRAR